MGIACGAGREIVGPHSNILRRQFTAPRPNKGMGHRYYVHPDVEGWLYLAVVKDDLFSRKIVGWSAGPTIQRELVLNAVLMAVRHRRPHGTVIHSD
jgi:putative transposase